MIRGAAILAPGAVLFGMLAALLPSAPAQAADPLVTDQCTDAILEAADRHGIPRSVALTVAKVESSGNPLAMNVAGWPAWARSVEDGVIALRRLKQAGIRSVDVGCMQINLKYHPDAFPRLRDAFDPKANTDYGIRFLKSLYEQKQSWGQAIATYHSSNPARQAEYLRRIKRGFMGN